MILDILGVNDLRRHVAPLRAELELAASRVVGSAWFVLGQEVQRFEQAFAAYCGVSHCVGVGNGTDAIELALKVLGVGPGKYVATVANAGMYSTTAILSLGAIPVYVEIDPASLSMSPSDLKRALASQTISAVVVTHLYGKMADMASLAAVAGAALVPIVEDCAQAHGAALNMRRAGSLGALGTFSFYPTKNLGALGDGGAVVTQSLEYSERLRMLRQYGWSRRYHAEISGGRNSRLDEIQAAFLNVMLPHVDKWNSRRRQIAELYTDLIQCPRVTCPAVGGLSDVVHLYVMRAKARDDLRVHLAKFKIPTDVHFPTPDYRQPGVSVALKGIVELASTEFACNEVVTLPCFPEMTDAEVTFIAGRVNEW